jgi:hypothetical protein
MFRRARGWMVAAVLLAISKPAIAVTLTESEQQLVSKSLAQIAATPAVHQVLAGASLRLGEIRFEGPDHKILLVSVELVPRAAPPVIFTGFVTLSYRLDRGHGRLVDPPSAELVLPLLQFAIGTEDKALALAHAKLETLPRYREWLQQGRHITTAATLFCPSGREDFWMIAYDVEGVREQAVLFSVDVRSGNVSMGRE